MNVTTHGGLSEHSVSDHVVTHDRKGREGKGREIGGEWKGSVGSPSTTSSLSEARDPDKVVPT